eukprot:3278473-Alexandrium_andersonii.AAC.1
MALFAARDICRNSEPPCKADPSAIGAVRSAAPPAPASGKQGAEFLQMLEPRRGPFGPSG